MAFFAKDFGFTGLFMLVSTRIADAWNFTVYSQPIELKYGEVYNRMQYDGDWMDHFLPWDVVERYASGQKNMAITGFTLDMVRKLHDGSEVPVKLNDHYLHHYILYFGESSSMRDMAQAVAQDSGLAHMLTGCHGMTGKGVRMYEDHLAKMSVKSLDDHDYATSGFKGVSFGSAAGAEYRHNEQRFEAPYRVILEKPEVWLPTFHIINTKDDKRKVSPLLECPCTPQRKIDPANGTIDGKKPDPSFGCSPAFAATGNPSCNLSTYVGGWRCCENGVFLIDTAKECKTPDCSEKPTDTVYMKFTFSYEDATPETREVETAACCDTTSDRQGDGNIEHDVLPCPADTPPEECIFVTESVQPVGYYDTHKHSGNEPSDLVDLVFAAPHLHWAGMSMQLIDHETNKTIWEVHRTKDGRGGVIYGNGTEPGNEDGYLVGLTPFSFGPSNAPRFRRDHLLRSRSVYDATQYHTGVMSLWLMSVSAVPRNAKDIVV